MNKSSHVINFSVIIVVVLGVLKSIVQEDTLPSLRFFFGAGLMWLFLSAMGEFEEDIAKTLALVIATVVVLRDGGDLANKYLGTSAATNLGASGLRPSGTQSTGRVNPAIQGRRPALPGTVMAQPGTFPVGP